MFLKKTFCLARLVPDRYLTDRNSKGMKIKVFFSTHVHHFFKDFEHRGWLPLLDVEHLPPAALIREFYSNLSIHSDCSNIHYVKTWIQGEEFVITLEVVASALSVPLV